MAQYSVPNGDVSQAGNTTSTDGGFPTPTYYTEINDGIDGPGSGPTTSKYVTLQGNGASVKVDMASMSSPGAGTKTLRIHASNNNLGGDSVDVVLDDGTNTETVTFSSVSSTATYSQTFTTSFNYSSLTADIQYDNFFETTIYELEIEIPDAGGGGGGEGPKLNPEAFLMFL